MNSLSGGSIAGSASLESVAHIIQLALTPVFLLSGIAALLNVFATRLARVADRLDSITEEVRENGASRDTMLQLSYLRRRSFILDIAVVVASVGGVATCGATLTLFVGALRDETAGSILFGFFGAGVICTIAALAAFVGEMLIASRGLRAEVDQQQNAAASDGE